MNARKFITVAALCLTSIAAAPAFADGDKTPGSGPNPYSECGIGAALFPDTNWAAVTSNVIWDLGSTAVTSATMSPNTCSGKKVKAALFIRDTRDQLVEDAARGEGAHLAAAMELFGCNAAARNEMVQAVRYDLGTAVTSTDYSARPALDKSAVIFNIFEGAASQHCGA